MKSATRGGRFIKMKKKTIVAMGGDGVGPEVIDAACHVLEGAGFALDILKPPAGEFAQEKYGNAFPEETRITCEKADAILFGATAATSVAILVYLRWTLDNYVNIRPVKYFTGAGSCLKDPEGIDFVILRENSEGLYSFAEGDLTALNAGLPGFKTLTGRALADFGDGKFAIRIMSKKGTRRFARFACEYIVKRKGKGHQGKLSCISKSNVLPQTDGLFEQIVKEEMAKYEGLSYERFYADDAAGRLLRCPKDFDVLVTTNMFGDVLSDEAAELVGGMGVVGSACVGGKVAYFEPVHGGAPPLAKKNVANPTSAIMSAVLMLEYLGMASEAEVLENAVRDVYKHGEYLTADQGGSASTNDFAKAVLDQLG
jgi:3-isopropylmalate dehydrogenase